MSRSASIVAALVLVGCSGGTRKPPSPPAQTQALASFTCSADGRAYILAIDGLVQLRTMGSPRSPLASARVCVQTGSDRPRCSAVKDRGLSVQVRRGDVLFVVTQASVRAKARLCPRPGTVFAAEFSERLETDGGDADRPPPDVLIDVVRTDH